MRRPLALLLLVAFTSGCALLPSRPPDLAYFPSPRKPGTIKIAHTLHRAAEAAGDDPGRRVRPRNGVGAAPGADHGAVGT